MLTSDLGTYALILCSNITIEIDIGRWGFVSAKPGYYIYVGSAFGPGGLKARVGRHFRKAKRYHWHIDYLRDIIDPVCAWCSHDSVHLEHEWAQAFGQVDGVSCIKGFGCSDCNCDGHLFAMPRIPDIDDILGVPDRSIVYCEYHKVA